MTTEHRTEELKRILRIFGRGCLHAGPDSEGSPGRISGNPADCEECLEAVADAAVKVMLNETSGFSSNEEER